MQLKSRVIIYAQHKDIASVCVYESGQQVICVGIDDSGGHEFSANGCSADGIYIEDQPMESYSCFSADQFLKAEDILEPGINFAYFIPYNYQHGNVVTVKNPEELTWDSSGTAWKIIYPIERADYLKLLI